jgi:phage terminase large subunit-like protein
LEESPRGESPLWSPLQGDGSCGLARSRVVVTRSATRENALYLAPGWVEEMEQAYRGSHLLPQELEGELVEDLEGAIFSRSMIEVNRVSLEDATGLERIVVAVDPPAGVGEKAAACGIVCAGIRAGVVYVLEDASIRGLRPLEWAKRVAEVARRRGAGRIIAEANQGGEMVRDMLGMAGAREVCVIQLRHAKEGKLDRAGPVSGLYEKGMVRHVGVFRELESEMFAFGAEGVRQDSPDRVDALVWAVRELTDGRVRPKIETL